MADGTIVVTIDNPDILADAARFRWLCKHPDWHFIERLCRDFAADSSIEFLAEMRRVIDARRSVELEPLEQHVPAERTVGCYECAWGKVAGCWRCGSR